MSDVDLIERIQTLLNMLAPDLAPYVDEDDVSSEMTNPVLSEWVLVANVVDLDTSEARIGVVASPTMLRSHVIGLLHTALDHS